MAVLKLMRSGDLGGSAPMGLRGPGRGGPEAAEGLGPHGGPLAGGERRIAGHQVGHVPEAAQQQGRHMPGA